MLFCQIQVQIKCSAYIHKIKFIQCRMAPKRKMESTNEAKENSNDSEKPKKQSKHWSLGLLDTMNDPEQQIKVDDKVIVIKDKYPKAMFHYLVMPNEDISDLKKLKKEHVDLLKHMDKVGHDLIKTEEHEGYNFKFGYHASASMQRLHLHVISDDFESPHLKTKKHWVSFTSDFFLKAEDVLASLVEDGFVKLPSDKEIKEYFNTTLKCHKCNEEMKHMPALKRHILDCTV